MVREKQQRFDDAIASFRRVLVHRSQARRVVQLHRLHVRRAGHRTSPRPWSSSSRRSTLDPENGYFIDSLGWAYYQQGSYAEALRELQRAVEPAKEDPEIFDHLADAYLKNGKVEEAIEAWEKAAPGGQGRTGSPRR